MPYSSYKNPFFRSPSDDGGNTNIKKPAERTRLEIAQASAKVMVDAWRKNTPSFADPRWDARLISAEKEIQSLTGMQKDGLTAEQELKLLEWTQVKELIKADVDRFHEQDAVVEQIRYALDSALKSSIPETEEERKDKASRTSEFYLLKGVLDKTSGLTNAVMLLQSEERKKGISQTRRQELGRTIGRLNSLGSRTGTREISGPIAKTPSPSEKPKTIVGPGEGSSWEQRAEESGKKAFAFLEQKVPSGDEAAYWRRERSAITHRLNSREFLVSAESSRDNDPETARRNIRMQFALKELRTLMGLINGELLAIHDREAAREIQHREEQERNKIQLTTRRAPVPPFTIQAVHLPDGARAVPRQPRVEPVPPTPTIDFGAFKAPIPFDEEPEPAPEDENLVAMGEDDDEGEGASLGADLPRLKIHTAKVPEKKSGIIGVQEATKTPLLAPLREGEALPPGEIIEREKEKEIVIMELPPEIDLEPIQKDGEAQAEKDIKTAGSLKDIEELIDGLVLYIYKEHGLHESLKAYGKDAVDVSVYTKLLSPELLTQMEEDAMKMLKKTNFRQQLFIFLKSKARLEALEKYLLTQPIPIENAEEYLGVSPHASRQAVESAYIRHLQGRDPEKDAREIAALHLARRKALARVEKAEELAKSLEEARERKLDSISSPERAKSKDLAELMKEAPAKKWWESYVPHAVVTAVGATTAALLGLFALEHGEPSPRSTAEPQAEVTAIPKPEFLPILPKIVEKPVVQEAIPASSTSVHSESVAPILSVKPTEEIAKSAVESKPASRDFTARSIVVHSEKGKIDTVDGILRSVFEARGVDFEKTSQVIRNFAYHQMLTENNLTERKGKDGKWYVDIKEGQALSLEGVQGTLDALVKKTGAPTTASSKEKESTSSVAPVTSGNPRLTKEGVGGGESAMVEQTSSKSASPESASSAFEKGYDIHVMKKWETVWKIIHNKLRERGLNWTSERINFLTQVVLDDNAENFRAAVASGQMKAMKDTAIPEGLTIDFTLASAIMDQMKVDRETKGKSMSVKEMAAIYGKKYPINLTFPS